MAARISLKPSHFDTNLTWIKLVKHIYSVFILLICIDLVACNPNIEQQPNSPKIVTFDKYRLMYTPGQLIPETLLELQIQGEDIANVQGEIVGLDMSMGKIPLFFRKDAQGNFSAQFLLGVCSEPDMFWQLKLKITDSKGNTTPVIDKFQAKYP